MATFVYDPAVRWPPPAWILLNYDVVPPDAPVVAQQGVLRSVDVVQHTYGAVRYTEVVVPAPPDPVVALDERVTALEGQMAEVEQQVHVAPVVIQQGISIDNASIIPNAVITTMQCGPPATSWAITYQDLNGLPTTGYWVIDSNGVVTATNMGAGAGIKKGSVITIHVQATNAYGTSPDGTLTVNT